MKRPMVDIDGTLYKVRHITWNGFHKDDLIDGITYDTDENKYGNDSISSKESDKPLSELLVWDNKK